METKRIPALFPHNHSSNILMLSNGDLMCVWFGGSREGKPDVYIQCSRLKKGEEEWSEAVVLSEDDTRSEHNPILFEAEPGVIWLMYTGQIGVHQYTSVVSWRRSEDYGQTWSPIEKLFDDPGIFIRHPPVRLSNGNIVLPAYYCHKSETGFLGDDNSVVKISSDEGKTWTEYPVPKSAGLVHMSIVKDREDCLIGFFRSRMADNVYRTHSEDGGITWAVPEPLQIPNNNASIQCIRLVDGRLAMVYNDINKDMAPPNVDIPPWFDRKDMDDVGVKKVEKPTAIWGVKRNPLVLGFSDDDGMTWKDQIMLITDEGFEGEPEFSYPSIYEDDEGNLHITYTYLRQYIRYLKIKK